MPRSSIVLSHAIAATTPNSQNPVRYVPVMSFKVPNTIGTKNPPRPPAAPTKPDANPICE